MGIFDGDHQLRNSRRVAERWPAERHPVAFRGIDGRELARQYALNLELSALPEAERLEHRAGRKARTARADAVAGAHGSQLQWKPSGKWPLSGRIAELLNRFCALSR